MESFFGFSFKVHHNFFKMTAWGERYNERLKNEDLDPQIFTISLSDNMAYLCRITFPKHSDVHFQITLKKESVMINERMCQE